MSIEQVDIEERRFAGVMDWHMQRESPADHTWPYNDHGMEDYSLRVFGIRDYSPVAEGGVPNDSLTTLLHAKLGSGLGNVGLDLAGGTNGLALQDLIATGIVDVGLVTNLEDRRSKEARSDPRLHHIMGNLLLEHVWEEIEEWRQAYAPEGLSLAMHLPLGGLQELPPDTYQTAIHRLLDMMRPGGVLLTQIPRSLAPPPDYNCERLYTLCCGIKARPDVADISRSIGLWDCHALIDIATE